MYMQFSFHSEKQGASSDATIYNATVYNVANLYKIEKLKYRIYNNSKQYTWHNQIRNICVLFIIPKNCSKSHY